MLLVFAIMRVVIVALVAVAIFSIVYVLISPDPTDDINAILRPNHTAKAQRIVSLPFPQSPILAVVPFLLSIRTSATQCLTTTELLDLVCVYRC